MMQNKFFLISIFIFFIYNFSLGQENCSNGIDDDLDGLIDLNDPECDCNGITISNPINSIPNPSFEQYNNCAHFWNDSVHNGYIESEILNWQRGNDATCDYYNCGFQNQIELTPPATPYPNGTGYIGIANGHDFSIGNIWKEYIGTLLSNPLLSGNNYEFSYYISGTSGTGLIPVWYAPYYYGTSNSDVEIVIYGYESIPLLSSFPQTTGNDCPTSTNPNWVVLGSEMITTTPNSWVQGNIQFTTTANIQAIMIGFNCNGTIGGMTQINTNTGHNGRWDYYYLDNFNLFEENYTPPPSSSINVTGNSCEGNKITSFSNTTSNSSITGYQWYENGVAIIGETSSSLNLSNLPNGQYELVTFYADGNCSRSNQIQHILPSLPFVGISSSNDTINCIHSSIDLNGSGGVSYLWTTNNGNIVSGWNTANPIVNQNGTYNLLVTDNNGCTSTDSITIYTDTSEPTVYVNSNFIELNCNQTTVDLQAIGNADFLWTTSDGNIIGNTNQANIIIDQSGYYLVTATGSNGCTSQDSILIQQDFSIPAISTTVSNAELNCIDTMITLTANGGATYNWNTLNGNILSGSNTYSIEIDNAGTYQVIVTGNNGCMDSTEITITANTNLPSVGINALTKEINCIDTIINLFAFGGEFYNWSTINGNIISSTNDSVISINSGGLYIVEVTGSNGCITNSMLYVSSNSSIPVININTSSDTLTCDSTIANISATGGHLYQWSTLDGNIINASNSSSIFIDEEGTYVVEVSGVNGCVSKDSITIIEDLNTPNITLNSSNPSIDCNHTNISLEALGAPSYTWSTINGNILNNNNDSIIWIDQAGTYHLLATSTNGCTSMDSITIAWDTVGIQINLGPDTTICPGENVLLNLNNSSLTYQWNQNLGPGASHLVNPIFNTEYIVTATSSNGCLTADSINIFVSDSLQIELNELIIINENCSIGGSINGINITGGNPSYSYTWLSNNQIISNSLNILNLPQGEYQLEIHDSIGCMISTIFNIGFNDISTVIAQNDYNQTPFQTPVSTMVDLNDIGDINSITILTHPNNGNALYLGNGKISYIPNIGFFGIDSLEYSICDSICDNICEKAWLIIEVERVQKVEIPNGVSPNGDGLNDFFEIQHIEYFPDNELVIFNRWGDIIYQVSPYQNDWYGQNENTKLILRGEQVVDGSYFYMLNLGDGSDPINGFIEVRSQ